MAGGRPTDYTSELGDLICEGIARKTPLARLCDETEELPTARTVYTWLRTHDEFLQNYTRAKEDQADYLAEECIDIADNDAMNPVMGTDGQPLLIDGKPVYNVDSASVGHAKLRVDTRKWVASKLKPKKYGDKIQTEHSGNVGITDLTEEQLDIKIQGLMNELGLTE